MPPSQKLKWHFNSGYHVTDAARRGGRSKAVGLAHTALSGTGLNDGGDFALRPCRDAAWLVHADEVGRPGYYATRFQCDGGGGARVAAAASARGGVIEFAFDATKEPELFLDLESPLDRLLQGEAGGVQALETAVAARRTSARTHHCGDAGRPTLRGAFEMRAARGGRGPEPPLRMRCMQRGAGAARNLSELWRNSSVGLHGISTSRPRRRRDPSSEAPRGERYRAGATGHTSYWAATFNVSVAVTKAGPWLYRIGFPGLAPGAAVSARVGLSHASMGGAGRNQPPAGATLGRVRRRADAIWRAALGLIRLARDTPRDASSRRRRIMLGDVSTFCDVGVASAAPPRLVREISTSRPRRRDPSPDVPKRARRFAGGGASIRRSTTSTSGRRC